MSKLQNQKFSVYHLAFTGMMAALVFATTATLQIPIILPTGKTMISLANAMCILSGLLLGPIYGGLAAGIGSFIYDLTDPLFITGSPFTLVFKFAMGFVCGIIAYTAGKALVSTKRRIIASVSGTVTYMILHLGKSFFTLLFAGSAPDAAFIAIVPKIAASSTNAVLAIVVAVPLSIAIQKALARSNLLSKLQ